jgi:3-dehydroquinate dehydratase II
MRKILIINGPNLNLLGFRKPELYGNKTLKQLIKELKDFSKTKGFKIDHFQSNCEGKIIDKLHSTFNNHDFIGCVINAGAYTHYSYAIRDAIESITIDCVEVHLTDIDKREDFRRLSVLKDVCVAQFKGLGIDSYKMAIDLLSQPDRIAKI